MDIVSGINPHHPGYTVDSDLKHSMLECVQYAKVRVDELGRVSLLTGATEDGVQYSEFHFGAGE